MPISEGDELGNFIDKTHKDIRGHAPLSLTTALAAMTQSNDLRDTLAAVF